MPEALSLPESSVVSLNIQQYRAKLVWRFLYKSFYRRLDMVVCQTITMQDDIIKQFSVPAGQTTIIRNPVDHKNISFLAKQGMEKLSVQPNKSRFRFVFVGGLRREKGSID